MSPTIPRHVAVRIFLSFAGGYFLSYALRSVNAALAPLLANDLSLSAGELGWLSSAYFLAFAVMQLPLGIALDRHGARRTESLLLMVAAAGALVMATGHSLWVLSLGRILIGLGVAACLMAPYSYYRRCFPANRQSQLAMWMLVAGTSGALVATEPALVLAEWMGWRSFFLSAALLLATSAAAIYRWTGDHDRQSAQPSTGLLATGFVSLISHPAMLRVIPTTVFLSGTFGALQSLWAGPWMTDVLMMTPAEAGHTLLYFNAALLVSYVAMSVVSPWLEKHGISLARQSMIAFVWFPACLLLMILWRTPDSWILWLAMAPGVPAVILMQTQTALAFPREIAGRILTTFNLVMFSGAFGIQWGIGLLIDLFQSLGLIRSSAMTLTIACQVALQVLSVTWFFLRPPVVVSKV